MRLQEILDLAEEELLGAIANKEIITEDDFHDSAHEIADSSVPIYHSDLLEVALDEVELAIVEPEILAFDGAATAVNAIAGNIYQEVIEHLHDVWNNREEEEDEEEEEEEEEEEVNESE